MTALQLNNISKAYKDGNSYIEILSNLNLTVEKGEFVAIVGPSGSGKSTLLSIAGMLLSPDNGGIILGNEDYSQSNQKARTLARRNKIGFIFQNHQLLPYLKIKEQLKLVADYSDYESREQKTESINELLQDLGMREQMNKYPNQLSGGEKQRVAIARAFMNKPDLILADEPTASLDGTRGRQITELIRNEVKKKQTAAVMVTHDERILDLIDTVYHLENGTLLKVK
jgi:putative ABC transport system ATP-binding protein